MNLGDFELGTESDYSGLDAAISQHFLRIGEFGLADAVAREAGVKGIGELKSLFELMARIIADVDSRRFHSAISWCKEHLAPPRGLEFDFHKLEFVRIVQDGHKMDALKYARAHFSAFANTHLAEISHLMTALVFSRRANSHYAGFFADAAVERAKSDFRREFCASIGWPTDCPLERCVSVGVWALPQIVRVNKLMQAKEGVQWTQQGELPIEIPLPQNALFHSTFVCPVLKIQTTEENPPMMMLCGHVICRDALKRLSRDNEHVKFKCPYCPKESTASDATRLVFE